MDETINPWVGVVLHKKTGDKVARGDLLAEAYAQPDCDEESVADVVRDAFTIGERATRPELLSDIVYG
jgi:pyrimidine-nucleoside phosphorylase